MNYPPPLSKEQAESLISDIKDYQLTHGSLLKLVATDEDSTVLSQPVGASVFPTPFPKELFNDALTLQKIYNKLYTSVADDERWLYETLKELLEFDPLSRTLWGIYEEVRKEGSVQELELGIFRNDYMLHVNKSTSTEVPEEIQLKQVEFNTISVAGGTHGNRISDMHRYLQNTGAYQPSTPTESTVEINNSSLSLNNTIATISSGLLLAHKAYGLPKSTGVSNTCILMIVQPHNFNIADERPLQYALQSNSPPIPTHRLTFGRDVLKHTTLTPSHALLFHPPSRPGLTLEVSVIYYRAAFEVREYDTTGRTARLRLERSSAIKCPSLLGHLTTFKKVQQVLACPGTLHRYLSQHEAELVSRTFAPLYPLDESPSGLQGRKLALDLKTAGGYVLKPSLEGGGHNVYGDAIPKFLAMTPKEEWGCYVLMGKISSPVLNNVLMSQRGIYEGPVISELGIFGVCLWKRSCGKVEMVEELEPSWSFKTKDANVDEMSVVKGFGCFDSPLLVERRLFATCCQ